MMQSGPSLDMSLLVRVKTIVSVPLRNKSHLWVCPGRVSNQESMEELEQLED